MAVDISPKQDGGVLKEILSEGTGDELPCPGAKVEVHYTGTLLDGTKFDSSVDRNTTFQFNLGKGSVIKAWDIGVATMRKGEKAVITCAPEYAYGKAGSPPSIPPDSTLKFEIEMIGWKGEDLSPKKDGSIERYQITPGEGYTTPNDGALVNVHIIGKYEGREFENRELSFNLGDGNEVGVCEGIEKALEKFKNKETSRLVIKPQYAFKDTGKPEFDIPPNATVEYIVTLKSFEKAVESYLMQYSEKVEQSKICKDKGTACFKAENYPKAVKMYKKITSYIAGEKDNEEFNEEGKNLLLSAHLNLSLCYLKLEQYFEARKSATEALSVDPKSVKGLFRRGQAQLQLAEPALALKDFQEVLSIEPNNKAAQSQILLCKKKMQEQLQKEKKIYANMFEKFAKMDAQREEEERKKEPDVMGTLGQWGEGEREREPSEFEKENPDILLLNGTGEFKDM